jgi:hypothetical protein
MFRLVLAEGRSLIRQRNEIEARAVELLSDLPDYQLLTTIPGIGPINAMTILAEAGDLRRFRHHRQFLKFCGMNLATMQSGQFRGRSRISKYGNASLCRTLWFSERFACRVLGQHRSSQRKVPRGQDDEDALTADIIALASQYGRYGYRRITALLREAGWAVNVQRVERIWRREGLKVPQKQTKKSRLRLNDGSCIRLRPERPNHVCTSRLRRGPDPRWEDVPHAQPDRRVHPGVPGDPDRPEAPTHRRHRCPVRPVHASRGVPDHISSDNVLCRERIAA